MTNIPFSLSIKELKEFLTGSTEAPSSFVEIDNILNGTKVIVRTHSAGCWFGTVQIKHKNEVILKDAKRLWRWHTKESISLSAIAVYGLVSEKSKIAPEVNLVWLEAIEIIPCARESIESIESAEIAEKQ